MDALGGVCALGGSASLVRLAKAAGQFPPGCDATSGVEPAVKDRYYIFCYFEGGWDVLLSLDPRDPALFSEENMSVTGIQPAYDKALGAKDGGAPYSVVDASGTPRLLGPFMGDLAPHFDKMSIVRGMSMDTLTHEVGRRRFITGKQPSGLQARGSSIATWLGSTIEAEQDDPLLIPNLAMNVESFNVDFAPSASAMKVSSVNDLLRAFQTDSALLSASGQDAVHALHAAYGQCPHALESDVLAAAQLARQSMVQILESNLHGDFDFGADAMAALRDHYGIKYSSNKSTMANYLKDPAAHAATAATALMKGVARVVSLRTNAVGLDTHYGNWVTDHGKALQAGFAVVARLVEHLACTEYKSSSSSWLDHTTIVCFSEFSRSPRLNVSNGRDHHLMNACLLIGAGIKGGTITGSSTDVGMMPSWTDLKTGQTVPNAPTTDQQKKQIVVVKPEHVLQALFVDLGMKDDPADLRCEPLEAILS